MEGEELVNWEENHYTRMTRIMDHRSSKKASGPKGVQRKEVVNTWALYEKESK